MTLLFNCYSICSQFYYYDEIAKECWKVLKVACLPFLSLTLTVESRLITKPEHSILRTCVCMYVCMCVCVCVCVSVSTFRLLSFFVTVLKSLL